jgi:hypothetical protein
VEGGEGGDGTGVPLGVGLIGRLEGADDACECREHNAESTRTQDRVERGAEQVVVEGGEHE